jgi:hypothetical protein
MDWKPYIIVGIVILLVVVTIYAFRHKDAILSEAWPDQFPKKERKKNIPPRLGAKTGAKKRPGFGR